MDGMGAAAIFFYASDSLAHTARRTFYLFLSSTNDSAHPRLRLFTYRELQTRESRSGRHDGFMEPFFRYKVRLR